MTRVEIEEQIYNLVQSIKHRYEREIKKGIDSSIFNKWDYELDDIGITVSHKLNLGILNDEWMTIIHPEYTAKYTRKWPDYSAYGKLRVIGYRKYEFTGNIERIKEANAFMRLSQ